MTKNKKSKSVRVQLQPSKKSTRPKKKEVTAVGNIIRQLGGLGGGALGAMIGRPIAGSSIGSGLGATLSRWLGAGDYTVGSNSIVNSMKAAGAIPMMHQSDQTIIVRHKEFLTEVSGNTSFTIRNSFPINPGMVQTFPWLSRLANNYQQYRIRGMVYHYVPTSGSATGTNTSLGSVMLQTSYRATDSAPSSKVELLNEYWSSEAVPSEAFCHPVECNPAENPFNVQYIRGVELPTGENRLMYDLGVTHLAVSGQQSTAVVGDLWATYEVELKKPIVSSNTTTDAFRVSSFRLGSPSPVPYGTQSNLGDIGISTNAYTITLPAGSVGSFYIFSKLDGPFTGADSWSGQAALSNCVNLVFDGFNTRWDYSATAGNSLFYGMAVTKADASSVATIVIPTASVGGGTVLSASLVVINGHSAV